eukprot:TRINITY_DN21664_c0_g1_i1.p1 TRINITY_DN21664_c0_g1~~TRINITY_DN21664_c0_g1_i1.p1  ORF type:complete len:545 (+),score=113.74 TRINITY_DN21664_c0_g1_i1:35-1636(+)
MKAACALLMASGAVAVESGSKMNFVFSFPDTLRAESFNSYGLKVPGVSPNVDAFAAEGTRFEQAHVMHTQCSPSRCTMLTGRYMHVGGHRTQTHLIQDYEQNYFRILKENGYHVKWIGKNDALSYASFNLSVSDWNNGRIGYPSGSNAYTYPEEGYFSFLNTGSQETGNNTNTSLDYAGVVESVNWLKNSPPEPFLLFLPSRGAHPPYGAPVEWHNKFSPEEVKKYVTLRPRNIEGMPAYMGYENGIPHYRNLSKLPEDTFYKIQSVYLGMIAYTDWIFGELLKGIEESGLKDRTTVFFSSDHGDFGGDYGLVEKWPGSLSDILTRVPLIARIPGGVSGHVSHAPVQTADILETMLDLAGITDPFVRFAKSLKSIVVNGTEGDLSRFVYSEGGFYYPNEIKIEGGGCLEQCPKGNYCPRGQEETQPGNNGSPRATMIRNNTAKFVYRPTGVSELYDLVKDPTETKNLISSPEYSALKNELKDTLLEWMVITGDVTPYKEDDRYPPKFPYPLGPDPWAGTHPNDYLKINGVIED